MRSREEELARQYNEARGHLIRVAYAVLGSQAEAEDAVADTWLKLVDADLRDPVRDVAAWATVAVARASLDLLRSARKRREVYPGEWLPEPVLALTVDGSAARSVEDRVTLDESVSYALLVVLETLSPAERVSFVLHDVFGVEFTEIARLVGRTPSAARQLASRARAHLRAESPRFGVRADEHERVFAAFLTAATGGDLAALVAHLDPSVVLTADGGGVVSAARNPVGGSDRVARFLLGTFARLRADPDGHSVRPVLVNGELGLALLTRGTVHTVVALTTVGDKVTRIDLVRAPEKLRSARRTFRL